MIEKMLILIRGLSGSGKTVLADSLTLGSDYEEIEGRGCVSADDFFTDENDHYSFNHEKLSEAHHWCLGEVKSMMGDELSLIVVHNTFKQQWEAQKYFNLAEEQGYKVQVISLYDGGLTDRDLAERNVHGLNEHQINSQRRKWDLNIHPHRQNRKSRHSYGNPHHPHHPPHQPHHHLPHHPHHQPHHPYGYAPPPPPAYYDDRYQGQPRQRKQNKKWSGSGRQY